MIVGRDLSGVGVLTLPTLEPCLRTSFDARPVIQFLKSVVRCHKPTTLHLVRKVMTIRYGYSACLLRWEQLRRNKRQHRAVAAVVVADVLVTNCVRAH